MKEKDEERQIRVFKNKFKKKDTHPDFNAFFTIDGKKYMASLFIRMSKDNIEYFGGRVFDCNDHDNKKNN